MTVIKTIAATVVALLLLAVVFVGIWHLGWFVEEQNVNKRAEISQDSYQRQNTLAQHVTRLTSDIATIDVQIAGATPAQQQPLMAQRTALVSEACNQAGLLTGTITLSPNVTAFIAKECP